ncbi:ABC-three component system protein [Enterococcus dispar]|uniref:ABC-three component system protein n=1 Tax=Enterococcus dispar TaxID=44009 RepID=UPI00189DC0BC|nr:ABC-three component system protein [Enterococcus dispar]
MSATKPNSNMLFIRQLEDIGQITLSDNDSEDYVMDLLYDKLLYENNSIRWIQDSEVTEEEVYSVEQAAKSEWRKQFRRIYRQAKNAQLTEEEILTLARQLFESIEDTTVDFSMEVTSKKKLGNGLFLNLSDKPVIGWHKDWEEKYSGEKDLQ